MSSKNETPIDTDSTLRVFLYQSVKGSGVEARFSDLSQIEIREFDPVAFGQQAQKALIICAAPIAQLCVYVTSGLTPSEALKRWMHEAQELLALQKRNRRQILLVEDKCFTTAPTADLKVLKSRLGISLREPVAYLTPEADPLLRVLVTHGVYMNEQARALISEVEAVCLGSDLVAPDVDQAFLTHQKTQAHIESSLVERGCQKNVQAIYTAQISELQSELQNALDGANNLHRQQVIELQTELQSVGQSEVSLQAQLQQVMQERDQHAEKVQTLEDRAPDLSRQQFVELQAELATMGQSEASLQAQLQQVMQERDQHAENLQVFKDGAPELSRQQLIELQAELGQTIKRENGLEQKLQAVTQERDLHAQQLKTMQDAVQEARHVYKTAEGRRVQTFEELSETDKHAMIQFQQIKRLHAQLQKATAEALQSSATIEQMFHEKSALSARIDWLEADRLKILSSGSWAVTKPLRSVNKMLGGAAKKKDKDG